MISIGEQPHRNDAEPREWVTRRIELVVIAILTIAAAIPRLIALDSVPPGLHGDEAWTGLEALRIISDGGIGVWSTSAFGQPAGPFYWTAAVLSIVEPSVASIRMSVALLGVLTIPAAFLFYRVLFGPKVALLGAAFLVVSFWHIQYSRIAFPVASLPLVETMAFATLFLALQRDRLWIYFLAGALLGLGFFSYLPYPFTAVGVAVFIAVWTLTKAFSHYPMRDVLLRVGILAFGGLLTGGPLLLFLAANPENYGTYARLTLIPYIDGSIFDKVVLLGTRAVQVVGRFFVASGIDYSDGLGTQPLLNVVTRFFFVIGLVVALRNFRRDPRYQFVLLILLFSMLPAILTSTNWGENRRMIGALPMVYLLAAIGVSWTVATARPWLKQTYFIPVTIATVSVLFLISAYTNLTTYFRDYASADSTRWVYAEELTHACAWVAQQDDEAVVYFYSGRWSYRYETCRLLAPDLQMTDRSREFGSFSIEKDSVRPTLYVFLPPYLETVDQVSAMYPDGERTEGQKDDRLLFVAYRVD